MRFFRWLRALDIGDPMRYVHGFYAPFNKCGRNWCWCNHQPKHIWNHLTWEEQQEQPKPLTVKAAYEEYGCICHLCRRPWLP